MTLLAVLGDLHANLSALKAVEADLERRGVEEVVVLGDLVGYLARPNQVVARVAQRGWPCLAGNYDQAVVTGGDRGVEQYLKPGIGPRPRAVYQWTCRHITPRNKEFLAKLPQRLRFERAGSRFLACHGSPRGIRHYVYPRHDPRELESWLGEAGVDCLLLAHTHQPFLRRLPSGLVLNPGSVGFPKDGDPRASYALVQAGREISARIVRLDYDRAGEAELARGAGLAGPPGT